MINEDTIEVAILVVVGNTIVKVVKVISVKTVENTVIVEIFKDILVNNFVNIINLGVENRGEIHFIAKQGMVENLKKAVV